MNRIAGMRGLRVLIIEDNVDLALTTRALLALHGHTVWIAANGHQGLFLARQVQPHAVLCDIGLPGITGYEVAQAFRRDENLRAIHLIAVTAYGNEEDIYRGQQAGFEHHLVKPVEPDHLVRVLEQVTAAG